MPAAAHICTHTVETHRLQSLQMLPAHFHSSTADVFFLHACTQKESTAAAAAAAAAAGVAAAAVVRECSVHFLFAFLNRIKLSIKLYTHIYTHTHTRTHAHTHTHTHTLTHTHTHKHAHMHIYDENFFYYSQR